MGGIPWVHRGRYHEYIGGIQWVHRGDIMSTSGGVQYIRGKRWVHRRLFSTSEGYHQYIGGILWVHRGMFSTLGDIMIHVGDTMSTSRGYHTSGGYHEYIRGYHEYIRGISWVHQGDIMSTLGDVQYIRGCSVHQGMFSTSGFPIEIEKILSSYVMLNFVINWLCLSLFCSIWSFWAWKLAQCDWPLSLKSLYIDHMVVEHSFFLSIRAPNRTCLKKAETQLPVVEQFFNVQGCEWCQNWQKRKVPDLVASCTQSFLVCVAACTSE